MLQGLGAIVKRGGFAHSMSGRRPKETGERRTSVLNGIIRGAGNPGSMRRPGDVLLKAPARPRRDRNRRLRVRDGTSAWGWRPARPPEDMLNRAEIAKSGPLVSRRPVPNAPAQRLGNGGSPRPSRRSTWAATEKSRSCTSSTSISRERGLRLPLTAAQDRGAL